MAKKYSEKDKGTIAIIALAFLFACMGVFARDLNASFTILQ
jgi:hypothetical protein